jgi:hypothetical protein
MIKYGIISFLIGGIGILSRGFGNLGKGEANGSYSPSATNNLAGFIFSVLFWGGMVLVVIGIISWFTSKSDK